MTVLRRRLLCLVAGVILGGVRNADAQLTVAAASDLQTVLPGVAARFERETGTTVRISFGSSGQLVSQIQSRAPFDVFLSADEDYVRRLIASGHADSSTVTSYATGRLALWSRMDRAIDLDRGLRALDDPAITRIAIANPAHAPYGRAAVDAMRRAGLYERLQPRLVFGENVSQAAQFAQTGNADVAIVALSLTLAPAMQRVGRGVEVPHDAYTPIRQAGVVVSASAHRDLGVRWLAFLRTPAIATLLQQNGFGAAP